MTYLQMLTDYARGLALDAPQLTVAVILFLIAVIGYRVIMGKPINKL